MIDFFEKRFLNEIRSSRENRVLGPRGSYGPETQLIRFGMTSGNLWTTPRPPEIPFTGIGEGFSWLLVSEPGFFGLGTILTTFWYEIEDFGETRPDSETSGRDLAPGKGLGGRLADI